MKWDKTYGNRRKKNMYLFWNLKNQFGFNDQKYINVCKLKDNNNNNNNKINQIDYCNQETTTIEVKF
jgi:hypothetical protein